MGKTVALSKFSEWKGLDCINAVVHEMHCIYREISKDDFGFDGEIEVVIPKEDGQGCETTGGIIKLQSKSGSSYVNHDNETHFYVYVKQQDLDLWNRTNVPVILLSIILMMIGFIGRMSSPTLRRVHRFFSLLQKLCLIKQGMCSMKVAMNRCATWHKQVHFLSPLIKRNVSTRIYC